jgi:glutamine kinase
LNTNYSKAKQLDVLRLKHLKFSIPKFVIISAINYQDTLSSIIDLKTIFKSKELIIRSSAVDEDSHLSSFAGEYASVLNVPSDNPEKINESINTVISSYEKKRPLLPEDEVIIQEMVKNTTMSGVVFTHDLNTGGPYFIINYDDQSGSTETVTSGNSEYANRTLYIHRSSIDKLRSDRFTKLLQAVQELEEVMESKFLDIEFALGEDLTPFLLQVRAITTQPNWNRSVTKRIDATLQGVQSFVKDRYKKLNDVYGKTTVLGQMPDWNPVEMIGRSPRALSTSLYKSLITDHAWRIARETMGYVVPTGQPLMVTLAGQPFIDIRLSFHSFLPKNVSPTVAEKLVNRWIENLKESPELHDKVEFEVAITTYSFDFDEKIEKLIGDVLNATEKEEFKQAHRQQTIQLIKGTCDGSISHALNKINLLNKKNTVVSNSNTQQNLSILFSMVDDCIYLGTVPFSILARHGFIAKTILLSFERLGIITQDEVNQIQASVHTVASELVNDMSALQLGALSTTNFMTRYGHLRPGTYDIMSHRYDQMIDFSSGTTRYQPQRQEKLFEFSKKQKQQIYSLLEESGFGDFNADDLLKYIREAITGREYSKFVFTRSVSDMLELIAKFAEENGLSRDEISHVPLNVLFNVAKDSNEISVEEHLRNISEKEAEKHDISIAIRLPQLLTDQAGVHIVPFQVSHPNFITQKKVAAPCIVLHSDFGGESLSGKIVITEGADPGFDWIFSQRIAGLITKYGGANSHMAIRCAEFGIPAAIGCGEQLFDRILKKKHVHLDCAAGLVNPVH